MVFRPTRAKGWARSPTLGLTALATLLGLGACHRGEPARPPAETTAASEIAPGGGMSGVTKPVMAVLEEERAHRPTGTPAVEAVFAAVTKTGVTVSDQSQVVARLVGASFCQNARTARGVVLGVCEFKDEDTLAKGRAYSLKTFGAALPRRTLYANRKTLLTINPPDDSPAVKGEVETIAGAFARL